MVTPNLAVSPSSSDFGSMTLGKGPFETQTFAVENTGNVNLKFDTMALTGADASEFSVYGSCSSQTFLRPSEQCQLSAQLMPSSLGNKQANLNLAFDTITKDIPLTGAVTGPADCSKANVTMVSLSDGSWDSSDTWDSESVPTASDVVQIQSEHTITGIAFAQVKALCIEEWGSLVSLDGMNLEIQAIDYIQNKGSILGKDGASEIAPCSSKENVGTESCANPGASIILKVGSSVKQFGKAGDQWWYSYESGSPIFNAGVIKAGNGGNGSRYAAPGGNVIVLGRDTTNTGIIQAGNGGSLTGTNSGEAGKGGLTQIWGKLGGPGHLYNQNGAQALAGNGGNCSSSTQTGGRGGNLWLVSLPNVHLGGGQQRAGNGGTGCGTNGKDGWVRIEPSVIDLSGANTVVSGGDIAIYGGNDWNLDLSNLSGTVINATGDITLAVGEGGTIDMRGSTGSILQAGGQVQIFADNIVLDENVALSDLVQASNIVVGPRKLLREVSLTGAGKLLAEPGITLPVNLILSNNGQEVDTYTLNVTDSAGWTLGQLPSTIDVKELDTVELVLNVTPPVTRGATDVITVTAVSQADSEVKASMEVQVAVAPENITTPAPSDTGMTTPVPSNTGMTTPVPSNTGTTTPVPSNTGTTIPAPSNTGTTTPPPSNTGTTTLPPSEKETTGTTTVNKGTIDVTTVESLPLHIAPHCSSRRVIVGVCGNSRRVLTDVTIGKKASLAGGKLAGTITNQGLLSNVIVQPGAVVSGGKLTGYIKNEGTLTNFEFVGASITGGILSGTIYNNSEVGGFFQDVQLAADTHIIGGIVTGDIKGDCEAQARLENVIIKSGSHLSCVIIENGSEQGDSVILAKGVTFGQGVQFANLVISSETAKLPPLNGAIAVNVQSETVNSNALFAEGIAINGGSFEQNVTASLSDIVDIRGRIEVDAEHIGQIVNISVVIAQPSSDGTLHYSMLDASGNFIPWDENMGSLVPLKTVETSAKPIEVQIYYGQFEKTGVLNFYLGYRLADGMVVYSPESLKVTFIE
jgi:hypothetical protein